MEFSDVLKSWEIIKAAPTIYCGCGSDVYTRFSYDCKIIDDLLKDVQKFVELIGIDFNVLIYALTNGIWLHNGVSKCEHHEVFLCRCNGSFAFGYEWSRKYGLQGWCLETSKYRKHWALSITELE